ncbi:MAG TPA: histidine kinase [Chitinophagaceae bacterium]
MKLNITTYWKYQLIGWGIAGLIFYAGIKVLIPYNSYAPSNGYKIRAVLTIFFGIVFTHIIRSFIKWLRIFDKKIVLQFLYVLLLTAIFSIVGNYLFLFILRRIEIRIIDTSVGIEPLTFFVLYYQGAIMTTAWVSIYFSIHYIRGIKNVEREKAFLQIQLIESEAQALRSQMNPHFVFNCMNSIKALIQNDEKQNSIDYLTAFSKLIRTLFQNADKRQISLYDEIETCRLYAQLEAMRLNGKLKYRFNIDPNLDLKSVKVPALIIQPFIENAVWHGIVPRNTGTITVTVSGNGNAIICEVDDDGIGRETSKLNKPLTSLLHESKGVRLSQARLNLEKMLNETNATIEIMDKYNISEPVGTQVILTFNIQ